MTRAYHEGGKDGQRDNAACGHERESLLETLRRNGDNLPHLLDVAVQILEDEGLLPVFEEVLSLDIEAARDDA